MDYGLGCSLFFFKYRQLYRQLCLLPKLRILEKKPPTPQENRPRPINSSCTRIKPIFNLWHIIRSQKNPTNIPHCLM